MAERIITLADNTNLSIVRCTLILGKELSPLDTSSTGLYAIVKSKTNWPLRITMFKKLAEALSDGESRKLRECYLKIKD